MILGSDWGVSADVWSVTSWTELRRDGLAAEAHNFLHPDEQARVPYVTRKLADARGPIESALASGSVDGSIYLWDVATGKKLRDCASQLPPPPKAEPEPPSPVLTLAFSPDSKLLALGTSGGQAHLVNVGDGKIARSLTGHTGAVTSLAFHPSGTVLASASKDHTVRLWNPANVQLLKALEGHTAWVQGVVFIEQGTRLASVGADQTVRVWELAPK